MLLTPTPFPLDGKFWSQGRWPPWQRAAANTPVSPIGKCITVETEVEDRMAQSTEKSVLVVADRSVNAEALVKVMDTCRKAGARQVAIAVDKE